jgi:DNA-binding Lrp family transcriptional regulator
LPIDTTYHAEIATMMAGAAVLRRLDDTDYRILQLLQANPRSPVSHVARQVGLTDNAVRYRIRRLQQAGIIREFVMVVDPRLMGRPNLHILLLRLRDPGNLEELVRSVPEACGAYLCEGEFDACLFVCAADARALEDVMEQLRQQPGVERVGRLGVQRAIRGSTMPLTPVPLGFETRERP